MRLRGRSAVSRSVFDLTADHFKSVFRDDVLPEIDLLDPSSLFISLQIGSDDLVSALRKLDDNIKSGLDGITPFFLKRCLASLTRPLLLSFNKSLSSGLFPHQWETSFIFPIHKSADRSDIENYRPISILSSIAKVFESIVTRMLPDFLLIFIAQSQHGFVKGRSVLTNLLIYNDFLFDAFKNKSQVGSIYFDFSKGFDTVNHECLENYGTLESEAHFFDGLSPTSVIDLSLCVLAVPSLTLFRPLLVCLRVRI